MGLAVDLGWEQVVEDHLEHGARDVAQDGEGFLWFATSRGLVRYDGERTVLYAHEDEHLSFWSVEVAAGVVWASTRPGKLYRVHGDALEPVRDESGALRFPLRSPSGSDVHPALVGGDDAALWVFFNGGLWRFDGAWTEMAAEGLPGVRPFHLRAGGDGVYLPSYKGLWHVSNGGQVRQIRDGLVVDVGELSDGRLAVQAMDLEVQDGAGWRTLLPHQNRRAIGLAIRDDVIFLEYDSGLFRVTADGHVDRVTTAGHGGPPLRGHAPPFVARDNTLWLGSVRLVEPDTVHWGQRDGVPQGGRWIQVDHGGVAYYSSWGGAIRLDRQGPAPDAKALRTDQVCFTAEGGAVGFEASAGVVDLASGEVLVPGLRGSACSANPRGHVWLLTADGQLLEVGSTLIGRYESPANVTRAVLETEDETLVIVGGTMACEASRHHLHDGREAWTCTELPERLGPNLTCLVAARPGTLWACTEGEEGLYERTAPHTWASTAANAVLSSSDVGRARKARSGGVWVQDGSLLVRLVERAGQWRIVERLGPESGLPRFASDVDEDPSGNLWTAGYLGVSFVPADRRPIEPPLVRPRLVGIEVDGQPLSLPARVPSAASVELHVAVLTYRYPESLRYRWRVQGGRWSSPVRSGTVRLTGLAGGETHVEVAARAGAGPWSEPVVVPLIIIPPWHRRPGFWLLVFGAVGMVVFAILRIRARAALRVEQQRASIAMDLHDELGAGLGSISILAGLLKSRRIGPARARDAAEQIASSAEELGASVTDIVWSLRTDAHTLSSLVAYVHDRGQNLFAGDQVHLRLVGADGLPQVPLAPAVARAVQLVLVEALYNAYKHARATEVLIAVHGDGRTWSIAVADNGVGLDPRAQVRPGGGTGLSSMQKRADAIGSILRVGPNTPSGFRVEIHFRPR